MSSCRATANKDDGGYLSVVASDDRRVGSDEHAGNAALIAAMRNALPAMLEELRAAREVIRGVKMFNDVPSGILRDVAAYDEATK